MRAQRVGHRLALDQRGRQFRGRGGGLDAVAALRRQPEEGRRGLVPANHEVAVAHEGAQAGPGVLGAPYRQRGGFLDAVDAGGHVQFLRRHVVRLDRIRVGRRAEQLTCVGLEVIAFVDAHHRRPGGEIHVGRAVEGEGGAAAGLQADRRGGAQRGHVIGPGAGRVDDGARAQRGAVGQRQRPDAVGMAGRAQLGIGAQGGAARPHAAQKALVQAVHVDVARVRLLQRAAQLLGAQAGHAAAAACGSIRRTLSECRRNSS